MQSDADRNHFGPNTKIAPKGLRKHFATILINVNKGSILWNFLTIIND